MTTVNSKGLEEADLVLQPKLYAAPHRVNIREKFFFLCLLSVFFRFFVFVFWPTETTTANLQGFTHLTPSKSTNQVTLRNKH